jgi:putative acetyltransferase
VDKLEKTGAPAIRGEEPNDAGVIAGVVAAAFGSRDEAQLVQAIRDSEHFVPAWSLVAEWEGEIVGHVMVSYATLLDGETSHRITTLSPLAVTPAAQGHGVGSALVREVAGRVDDHGVPLIVLEGSPAYYGRLGFEHSVPYGIHITLPEWAPAEAAQVLRLRRYDRAIRGRVVYPPAFDLVTEH